jgi:DNA-cytosine methyltransferase
MLTHASLFSGIGGFDLAAEWAGWENIFHCEWNPFGQKVLAYHFPNSKSYHDITKTDFSIHEGSVDVLTGGFPCQPYSMAGKRLGKEDDRHLWPEMLRTIREIKPRWIVGENVLGIISWGGGWFSRRCKLIWKLKATKYKRLYFQLQVSTLRIKDNEHGLLLTPSTKEDVVNLEVFQKRMQKYANGTKVPNLATQVISMLPTPMASEGYKLTGSLKENQMSLTKMVRQGMLPTPSAFDWNTAQKQDKYKERQKMQKAKGINLHYPLKQMAMDINPNGKTSQLNPLFVEEMMGFPEHWTTLPFLNGETNQSKPTETQ